MSIIMSRGLAQPKPPLVEFSQKASVDPWRDRADAAAVVFKGQVENIALFAVDRTHGLATGQNRSCRAVLALRESDC
jgi:hypothetical protein